MTAIRKGQAPAPLDRSHFSERFRARFADPAFKAEQGAIARLEDELSMEWLATRERLAAAQRRWADQSTPSRVLIVNASARNDGTCPGEISKTWRLASLCREVFKAENIETDLLDLSRITSDYDLHIHPCKGCVSTAMPLCHWPCSCYPNHATAQVNDWMAEIYEQWVAAHGVVLLAPVYWFQSPSPLKLMIDRLVCADGGNPDPTRTHGKKAEEAKRIEAEGWDYPQHLAGRTYGLVVHGDVAGIEQQRHALADWLDWMGLVDAGATSQLARYVGYYEPYYTSHDTLDRDTALQDEVRNVALAVAQAVGLLRQGRLSQPGARLREPRPK